MDMEDGRGGAAAAAAGRAWLFCEGCGGLLDFLAEEGVARCGICRRTRPQADFQDVQLVSRMTHEDMRKQFGTKLKIASSQAVDTQQSIKRATVRETCPQCGHKEMEFFTMQLRSVDEGQTVFYECPQCRYKYSVNTLYKGGDGIPIDRKADDASTVGAGNKYSLAMDYIDLQPGTYHLSVQCQDDAVKYRTAVTLVAAELHEYDIKIGNVSPEQWTFHKFSFTGSHEPHLKFKFRVFSGNVFAVFAREEKPPGFATPASNHYTKVIEPAEQVQHKGEEILFCNASDRVKYIGVFGGDLAAEYEITADAYSGECSEEGDAYVAAAGRGNGAFDAWRGGRVGGVVIAALALVMGVLL